MLPDRKLSAVFGIFVLLILARGGSAEPFDVLGYRQGMSLATVEETARKSGHTLRKEQDQPVSVTVLQGKKRLVDLSLCGDRVFYASRLVDGKLDRFVKQLETLTKLGFKKVDVSWSSMLGLDDREHYDLTVYFVQPGSERDFYVTATLFASENLGTTNSQVTYRAHDNYCKSGRQ